MGEGRGRGRRTKRIMAKWLSKDHEGPDPTTTRSRPERSPTPNRVSNPGAPKSSILNEELKLE